MKPQCNEFMASSRLALADEKQKAAIRSAAERLLSKRAAAFPDRDAFLKLRKRAREIKEQSLLSLPSLLDEFEKNVKALGGNVIRAADASEAREAITAIARTRGVRRIVKSKSMTAEEIALNDALEADGREVIESDLGEYIIQLAGETPFHIVAPALHWTKEDVSRLFSRKLGSPGTSEIEELTLIARSTLREIFRTADMGITGCNFAAADTGTIAIVENEGNGRMTSTLPPIHVVLLGIEKVVAHFSDLDPLLSILTRNATGQKRTSYISFITGPLAESGRGETLKPELHVVLLDNGRSKILSDPWLREALLCIRCGACLNICPVYQSIGGHAYGWVYPGPIGSILTPLFLGPENAKSLPFASSLCAACAEVCPVAIDLPQHLLRLRSFISDGYDSRPGRSGFLEKLLFRLWAFFMESKTRYRFAARAAYFLQLPFARNGKIGSLPYPFSSWTSYKDFPMVSRKPFHVLWKEREKQK